jgi:hypothetical protein
LAGHLHAARLLIQHGACLDAVDHQRNTPLMFAAVQRHTALVQLLLEAGADPEITNTSGKDPQVVAAVVDSEPIARLLRENVLRRRGAVSDARLAAVGGHVANIPAGKALVLIGGTFRDTDGLPNRPVGSLDASPAFAVEMIGSMPLDTFDGWLKQIDADELNPIRQIALDRGFRLFLEAVSGSHCERRIAQRPVCADNSRVPPSAFEPVISCVKGSAGDDEDQTTPGNNCLQVAQIQTSRTEPCKTRVQVALSTFGPLSGHAARLLRRELVVADHVFRHPRHSEPHRVADDGECALREELVAHSRQLSRRAAEAIGNCAAGRRFAGRD